MKYFDLTKNQPNYVLYFVGQILLCLLGFVSIYFLEENDDECFRDSTYLYTYLLSVGHLVMILLAIAYLIYQIPSGQVDDNSFKDCGLLLAGVIIFVGHTFCYFASMVNLGNQAGCWLDHDIPLFIASILYICLPFLQLIVKFCHPRDVEKILQSIVKFCHPRDVQKRCRRWKTRWYENQREEKRRHEQMRMPHALPLSNKVDNPHETPSTFSLQRQNGMVPQHSFKVKVMDSEDEIPSQGSAKAPIEASVEVNEKLP